MALRIGLLTSSALPNDGLDAPSFCSAELLRRPILVGHWVPNHFLIKLLALASPMYPVLVFPVLRSSDYDKHELQSSRRNSQLRHCRGTSEVYTLCIRMAIVRVGIPEPRLGTWRSPKNKDAMNSMSPNGP
jgi:hypothetical protein